MFGRALLFLALVSADSAASQSDDYRVRFDVETTEVNVLQQFV